MMKIDRPKGKSTTNAIMAKLNQFQSQQQAQTNEDSHIGDANPTQTNSSTDSETDAKKTRGPTLCKVIWTSSKKIKVRLNQKGQPVGKGANSVKSFLGTIARNGRLLPLTYPDWRKVPQIAKEDAWEEILARFRIGLAGKIWFRKSLAKKWKDWKAELKAGYYDPEAPYEVNVMNREPRVSEDQWRALINYWMSDVGKKRSEINKANRTKLKIKHTCGSRSLAQIREAERVKRPDKKEPSRAEMFIITHKQKNGDVVDKKSAKIISKLERRISEHPESFSDPVAKDDIYAQVMGNEKNGYMRTFGVGPIPSDFWGALPSRVEALKMAAEAQETAKKEVTKMCNELKAVKENAKKQEAQQERLLSFIKSKFPERELDEFLSTQEVSNLQSPLSPHDMRHSRSGSPVLSSSKNSPTINRKRKLENTNGMEKILSAKKGTWKENTNEASSHGVMKHVSVVAQSECARDSKSLGMRGNRLQSRPISSLDLRNTERVEKRKEFSHDLPENLFRKDVKNLPFRELSNELRSPQIRMRNDPNDSGKKKPFQDIPTTVLETRNLDWNNQKLASRSMVSNNDCFTIKRRKSPPEDMHAHAKMMHTLNVNQTLQTQDRLVMRTNICLEPENRVFLLGTKKPYPVVAQGYVISKSATSKVDGNELGPLFWEIYIDIPIITSEILPRPYGRYAKIGDCAGVTIAWPNFLVKPKPNI